MSPQPEDRRSPVEPGIAEIRKRFDRPIPSGCRLLAGESDVRLLLDHIDTLTAERDALRALLERWTHMVNPAHAGDLPDLMLDTCNAILCTQPDISPEPVEPPPEVTP